jgi:hypothetical protein
MTSRVKALPELGPEQALAADPVANASLSASAGTGKTQVLTARVLRLMLHGASPESILCLTFTKAAAAEMANRIGERLAAWVRMPDKALRKELFALREANDPTAIRRARQLFAKVLDCPGGLRIQTIHSFAQALLAAFPAEAGIAPGFEPIEGRAEQELARSTLANLLAEAEANGQRQLVDDVQQLSLRLGEIDAVRYLIRCGHSAEAMAALGAAGEIEPKLREMMHLPEGSVEEFLDRAFRQMHHFAQLWLDLSRRPQRSHRLSGVATAYQVPDGINLSEPEAELLHVVDELPLAVRFRFRQQISERAPGEFLLRPALDRFEPRSDPGFRRKRREKRLRKAVDRLNPQAAWAVQHLCEQLPSAPDCGRVVRLSEREQLLAEGLVRHPDPGRQPLADPVGHLRSGRLGEGQAQDRFGRCAVQHQPQHPRGQDLRLPRSRRCRQRRVRNGVGCQRLFRAKLGKGLHSAGHAASPSKPCAPAIDGQSAEVLRTE